METWKVNNKPTSLRIRGKLYSFRSQAEAIYAISLEIRLLSDDILAWHYEPSLIQFAPTAGRIKAYVPDFLIYHRDGRKEWVEIKGKMDPASRVKIQKFEKEVAPITVIRTDSSEFALISLIHKPKLKFYQP